MQDTVRPPLKVIYMGSPDFAIPALQMIHEMPEIELLGVASNPDKRRGRGGKLSPTPVKSWAIENQIPTFDVESTKDESFHDWLRSHKPDLFIVVAFRILPVSVLSIPTLGSINIHASLLPKYRGAAPIHHALMHGETETGLSSFFLNEKMDAGKLIHQVSTSISIDETTGEVYQRLMQMSSPLIKASIEKILTPDYILIEQDHKKASPAPKIFDVDCMISWNKPAAIVHNHIRGLSPFPSAYTLDTDGVRYKVLRTTLLDDLTVELGNTAQIGDLIKTDGKVFVRCLDSWLNLVEVKPEGRKLMSGIDLWNSKPNLSFKAELQ